jgi:hypothetical protein
MNTVEYCCTSSGFDSSDPMPAYTAAYEKKPKKKNTIRNPSVTHGTWGSPSLMTRCIVACPWAEDAAIAAVFPCDDVP